MQTKICTKCKKTKPIEQFTLRKRNKDGYCCWCKQCKSEYYSLYREKHYKEIQERMHKWHNDNKEKEKEYRIQYRPRRRELDKIWREKNIEKSREYHKQYKRNARIDELIYAKDRIRNMISLSFRRKNYTKKSKTYQILGEKYDFVWEHLKKTWYENYGEIYNGEPYEIDHKIPLATAKTEEDVIRLCHYTNLQLLTPEDNLKKGKSVV